MSDEIETRRAPFAPKGEQPEWQMLYEGVLADADFGTVIPYATLDEALGRPFRQNRGPLYRANRYLGEMRKRHLEPVPGVGYRVIEASEHLIAAQKRKHRARRQLAQMVHIGAVVDTTRLNPDELSRWDAQQRLNVTLCAVVTHHENRIARIESVLQREGLL